MLISYTNPIEFQGQQAEIRVLRNDGFCWGHITAAGGRQFDVNPRENGEDLDLYDEADADALETLERLAQDPTNVSPAARRL